MGSEDLSWSLSARKSAVCRWSARVDVFAKQLNAPIKSPTLAGLKPQNAVLRNHTTPLAHTALQVQRAVGCGTAQPAGAAVGVCWPQCAG